MLAFRRSLKKHFWIHREIRARWTNFEYPKYEAFSFKIRPPRIFVWIFANMFENLNFSIGKMVISDYVGPPRLKLTGQVALFFSKVKLLWLAHILFSRNKWNFLSCVFVSYSVHCDSLVCWISSPKIEISLGTDSSFLAKKKGNNIRNTN